MVTKKKPQGRTLSASTVTSVPSLGDLTRATPQSAAVIQVGGTIASPGYTRQLVCRICQHPARGFIEQWLSRRWSLESINRALRGDDDHKITQGHIDSHLRLCLGETGLNTLVNWLRSQDPDYDPNPLARIDVVIENLVSDVEQAVDSGQIAAQLKPADVVAIAKLVSERESAKRGAVGKEVFEQVMVEYFEVLRGTITPEQQEQISRQLAANPVLRALSGRLQEPTIIETDGKMLPVGAPAWDTEGFVD